MNPDMYFQEARLLEFERTDSSNIVQRRRRNKLLARPLFSRIVLPTGCILYQLVRY